MRDTPGRVPASQAGTALPLVLIFAVLALGAAGAYLMGQGTLSRSLLARKAQMQALLNARSGVYWALDRLADTTRVDTLRTINTLDRAFGSPLFGDTADTGASDTARLVPGGGIVTATLYDSGDFGSAKVSVELEGSYKVLFSRGLAGEQERRVRAKLGGRCVRSPDTLVYKPKTLMCVQQKAPSNSAQGVMDTLPVRQPEVEQVVAAYIAELAATDSVLTPTPVSVLDNERLADIPQRVEGNLLVDGSFARLNWTTKRRYVVEGDLQFSGEVEVDGPSFVVGGEVRVYDKAHLKNVPLFATGRILIGGVAVYSGDAFSLKSIVVLGKASVEARSSLVVVTPKAAAPTSKSSPAGPKSPPANSSVWQDTTQYAVLIGEQAAVEAVVVALGPGGSIRTDPKTLVRGVLCAQTSLCHNGKLAGAVMVVGACTDCVHPPDQQTLNTITGGIVPLDTVDRCVFPSFMGKPYVFEWIEN